MADSTRRVSVRLSLDDAARVKSELREVGETGSRSLDRIQDGADRASRALSLMDVAVRGIQLAGVAAGLRALVMAGDALSQSMGRLTTAVGGVERAAEVYEALYRDALQTGVAVRESVDAFQRFSIAAREIGATSDEVLRLVGGLQRVAISSGASTAEIQGSTQQLAQALASGVLQGDELRSILEGLPTLAQALAGELGVSIGELRKLGSEGKLTADVVFPALLRAVERVNSEFERAPLSVSRAYGQLTAAADQFLARLDQAVGLSNTLARALSGAARVLDGARRGAGLLTDDERLADQRAQRDALAAEIARLEAQADPLPPRRGSLRPGLAATAEQQAGVDRAERLDALRRQYAELTEEVGRLEAAAATRSAEEQAAAQQRAADAQRRRAAEQADDLRRQLDDRFRIESAFEERVRTLRAAEAAGAIDAAEGDRLLALATRERDAALQRLEGSTRRVATATREAATANRDAAELQRDVTALLRETDDAYDRLQRRLAEIADLATRAEAAGRPIDPERLLRAGEAALEAYARATRAVEDGTTRASDAARELGLTFTSAFEDAILRGERFSAVLQGLGQDIARILVRRSVTEPLGNAVSAAIGPIGNTLADVAGSLFGSLFGGARAEGGPVAAGRAYLVGERGPELLLPRQDGVVLPNAALGRSLTFAPTYNIDARGADASLLPRLRAEMAAIAQASLADLEARVNRGGTAARTFGRR